MRRKITSMVAKTSTATVAVLVVGALGTSEATAATTYTPVTTVIQAEINAANNPSAPPPGVNVPGCKLNATHPRPVILINGTTQVMQSSFGYLGPVIANAGYCVYGYNYGGDPTSSIQALGPVKDAAFALATEVTKVKAQTGAKKVDLVGYSQGGLVAELYTKFLGAANVNSVTALSPTTHGTTLSGIATLGQLLGVIGLVGQACPACADQVVGSDILKMLNTGPIAQPNVQYTVIDTKFEDVVTPAGTSFINEPGVVNQYVQTYSSEFNFVEHIGLPYDATAASLTTKALARAALKK